MDTLSNLLNSDTLSELIYLYERWEDEKTYEDWKDYENEMKDWLNDRLPSAKFVKGTQEPFGLQYQFRTTTIHTRLKFTKNLVQLESVKINEKI